MTATLLRAKPMTPGLTSNDLEASIRFYTEGLGFNVDERWEEEGVLGGVMLSAGEAHLGLSQDDFAKGRDRVKGVGMRLFLETDQDIDALARQAKESGIEVDGPAPLPWGPVGFTVTDPDGFKVTVSKPN